MSFLRVDLKKIKNNFCTIKNNLNKAELFCVVKSDAYGCGARFVAPFLQRCGADGFVVADVEEGVALRKAGVCLPIVVLGRSNGADVKKALAYNLTLSVFNEEYLRELYGVLRDEKTDKKSMLQIWLKINCGFNRVGFTEEKWQELSVCPSSFNDFLQVTGIFAHFREFGDKNNQFEYVQKFERGCALIKSNPVFSGAKRSLANSCALRNGFFNCDVARVGASLYGLGGDGVEDTVAEFFAKILQINFLKKGQTVGYDDTFVAQKDCRVAVLDVGYADGLPRSASRLGVEGYLSGVKLPFVGSVCMNHSFLLLDENSDVTQDVEIFGKNISATSLAQKLNTIDYEILCRFGKSSKKIYLH